MDQSFITVLKQNMQRNKTNDIYLVILRAIYLWNHRCHKNYFFKVQPKNIKDAFTRVLKGHIAVATANISKKLGQILIS